MAAWVGCKETVVVKGTFLDVEVEEECIDDLPAIGAISPSKSKRRSSSLGAVPTCHEEQRLRHLHEEQSVHGLNESMRLWAVKRAICMLPCDDRGEDEIQDEEAFASTTTTRLVASDHRAEGRTVKDEGHFASSAAATRLGAGNVAAETPVAEDKDDGNEAFASAAAAGLSGPKSSGGRLVEAAAAPPPPRPGGWTCNRGSVGHPHLCGRPCKWSMEGGCWNGASCNYCHVPHASRPGHFRKHARQPWKGLELEAQRAAAVWALAEKIQRLNFGPRAMDALQAWTSGLPRDVARGRRLPGRDLRGVMQCLVELEFRTLCNIGLGAGHGAECADQQTFGSHSDPSTVRFLDALKDIVASLQTAGAR